MKRIKGGSFSVFVSITPENSLPVSFVALRFHTQDIQIHSNMQQHAVGISIRIDFLGSFFCCERDLKLRLCFMAGSRFKDGREGEDSEGLVMVNETVAAGNLHKFSVEGWKREKVFNWFMEILWKER
jgi:hypothetical protein